METKTKRSHGRPKVQKPVSKPAPPSAPTGAHAAQGEGLAQGGAPCLADGLAAECLLARPQLQGGQEE